MPFIFVFLWIGFDIIKDIKKDLTLGKRIRITKVIKMNHILGPQTWTPHTMFNKTHQINQRKIQQDN